MAASAGVQNRSSWGLVLHWVLASFPVTTCVLMVLLLSFPSARSSPSAGAPEVRLAKITNDAGRSALSFGPRVLLLFRLLQGSSHLGDDPVGELDGVVEGDRLGADLEEPLPCVLALLVVVRLRHTDPPLPPRSRLCPGAPSRSSSGRAPPLRTCVAGRSRPRRS